MKTFTFEHALISSPSFREEGVLIIPQKHKDLHPLFVPKDRNVPFFLKPNEGCVLEDYFDRDSDELHNIFTESSNLLSLWKELEEAGISDNEYSTWTVLDIDSNIILKVSQIDDYYDNMMEVGLADPSDFDVVIQIAHEQDFVLSKIMYEKYMEIKKISKQDLFQELKELGADTAYTTKVEKAIA